MSLLAPPGHFAGEIKDSQGNVLKYEAGRILFILQSAFESKTRPAISCKLNTYVPHSALKSVDRAPLATDEPRLKKMAQFISVHLNKTN